jgi:hypothetical protein
LLPALYNDFVQAAQQSFDSEKIRSKVHAALVRSLDPPLIQQVMRWFETPLGRKITALEHAASAPEAFKEIQNFADQLKSDPPRASRLALVERLDIASGASEKAAEIRILSFLATFTAMNQVKPEDQRIDTQGLRREVEARREEILSHNKMMTKVGFLYSYRSLSDADLERYVSFSESEPAKTYDDQTYEALKAALLGAISAYGKVAAGIVGTFEKTAGG